MKKILIAIVLTGFVSGMSGITYAQMGTPTSTSTNTMKESTQDTYPMDTCVVTGKKLGSMGKPVVMHYKGKEVRLCCSACVKEFNKNPDKYMKMIEDAEKQKAGTTTPQ